MQTTTPPSHSGFICYAFKFIFSNKNIKFSELCREKSVKTVCYVYICQSEMGCEIYTITSSLWLDLWKYVSSEYEYLIYRIWSFSLIICFMHRHCRKITCGNHTTRKEKFMFPHCCRNSTKWLTKFNHWEIKWLVLVKAQVGKFPHEY